MLDAPLALGGAVAGAGLLLYLTLFVVALRRRPWPAGAAGRAATVAALVVALRLPYQAISLQTLDPAVLFDDLSEPMVALLSRRVVTVAWVSTVITTAFTALLHLAAAGIAHTTRPEEGSPWPLHEPRRGLLPAMGGALVLVAVAFAAGSTVELTLHPSLAEQPMLRRVWACSAAASGAVGAEILWRGAVQGLLVQRLGTAAVGITAVLAALPSAAGGSLAVSGASLACHLLLGALAHRWSLTTSTVAHLVGAVVAALFFLEVP
jgi:hypothetical protein